MYFLLHFSGSSFVLAGAKVHRLWSHVMTALEISKSNREKKIFQHRLTVSPDEFGKTCCVAAGELRGTSEGGRWQVGHQCAVTAVCAPITKQNESRGG